MLWVWYSYDKYGFWVVLVVTINKFWAKMKMIFVGVGLMSMLSFFFVMMGEIFQIKISALIFMIISFVSALIAEYSNYRRRKELKEEK